MKTIKVAEATELQLDWLVWKCAGGAAAYPKTASGPAFLKLWHGNSAKYVHPSTDPAQGQPILEREGINLKHWGEDWDSKWSAHKGTGHYEGDMSFGDTQLIAGLRCYVASKLGETVEVPEELT